MQKSRFLKNSSEHFGNDEILCNGTFLLKASVYTTYCLFDNSSDHDISISLELSCEEIIMSPGHKLELLIPDYIGDVPPCIIFWESGIQVYPPGQSSEWLIKFNGNTYLPGCPTILKNLE